MIIPRIVVPESVHCGMKVSATVAEIAVPDYGECPYELIPLYKEGYSVATVTVLPTIIAAPRPVLQNDFGLSEGRVPILIDVLANDPVPFGDVYTIHSFTQPSHGSVTQDGTQLLYTPLSNFDGEDAFTYTVVNTLGGKETATVNLVVTPVYYRYASGSYTLDPTDAIAPSLTILGGIQGLVYQPKVVDGIMPALTILGGSHPYMVRYLSASGSSDAVASNFSVLGGSYPVRVVYLTIGTTGLNDEDGAVFPDSITSSFSILGGSYPMTVRYLSASIIPEAITPTFSILGGTN